FGIEFVPHIVKSNITNIFKTSVKSLCKITFSNDKILICTPNHPIFSDNMHYYIKAKYLTCFTMVLGVIENRSRWRFPLCSLKEETRCKKRNILERYWVESVEILQPGSDGTFRGMCPDGFVYNIEVKEYNNYFANGILVHNCHHTRTKSFSDILNYFNRSLILGVTATPIRLDSKGLGKKSGGFFDILVQGPTPKELISQGYLAEPIVYAPPSKVDFSQVRTKFGDYDKKVTADLVDKPKITGDCIEHYQRICPGAPAIAFTISIEHAEHVAKAFNDAGIPAMSIDGKKSNDERKFILDSLENGTIQVVTSCDLISEGLDIPKVKCAIGLRPTASPNIYIQQSGRPLRPYPGKTYCYILDHVGNIHRHGSPIADREWTLDTEEIGPSKGLAPERKDFWICDKCYASNNMSDDICAQCGEGRKVNSREIKEIEGQLQKIKEEEIERETKWNKRIERKQAKTLEDLQALEKARGYKRGWAEFVYNGRRGR
ncbi:hypothetical protein LCGC14_1500580, partial [marine sediment metagenome]